jgi:phosphate transport system permease protein
MPTLIYVTRQSDQEAAISLSLLMLLVSVGVLVALYLTEFAGGRATHVVRLTLDLMNGLPSIIIGLFIFGLLVNQRQQSGMAAAVALAIIEVPLIARGTQEVLMLIPANLREAADALGVSRWRAVLGIVLPAAAGGILTATVLSVARAAGETAPLIFATSVFDPGSYSLNPFEALPNVPVRVFQLSEEANPAGFAEAWGLSFVLVSLILFASLGARALLARSKKRMAS